MKQEKVQLTAVIAFIFYFLQYKPAMARQAHTHHHHKDSNNRICTRCPPGYGVEHRCGLGHDTTCTPCQSGHYSSHHSALRPCYPCSLCGVGLYVAHPCTPYKDTVCDSCHTYKGPHNQDFYERCVRPLLQNQSARNSSTEDRRPHEEKVKSLEIKDRPLDVPPFVLVLGGIAIGALAVVLLATCFVAFNRRRSKATSLKYPYQAVSTQEVML